MECIILCITPSLSSSNDKKKHIGLRSLLMVLIEYVFFFFKVPHSLPDILIA